VDRTIKAHGQARGEHLFEPARATERDLDFLREILGRL
jgi:hypothetical protein